MCNSIAVIAARTQRSCRNLTATAVAATLIVLAMCFSSAIATERVGESANPFATPERAIKTFQQAFVHGDTATALASWDFPEAARLTQRTVLPAAPPGFFDGEAASVQRQSLERTLEVSLLEQMQENVVARFVTSKCRLSREDNFAPP